MYLPKSLVASHLPCTAIYKQLTHDINSFQLFMERSCAVILSAQAVRPGTITAFYPWDDSMEVDQGWTNWYLASLPLFPALLTCSFINSNEMCLFDTYEAHIGYNFHKIQTK